MYGTRATGDATEARRIVRAGARGAPLRCYCDGDAALPITALSRFPTKDREPACGVRLLTSCEPLEVNSRQIRISMSCLTKTTVAGHPDANLLG